LKQTESIDVKSLQTMGLLLLLLEKNDFILLSQFRCSF